MNKNLSIEVCANSVESAIEAEKGGAIRVELCDNLFEGGTTPSAASIELVKKYTNLQLFVIIRPRGGDFCYSDIEFEIMKRDIELCKDLGADGVVIGILNKDGSIDIDRNKTLVDVACPMKVTFHRAFDMTNDPIKALEDVIATGCDRILTSGQKQTALEGAELIKQLIEKANGRILIMPGSGIKEENIAEVARITQSGEYHVSLRQKFDSVMEYRNPEVLMGGNPSIPEYEVSITDSKRVKQLVDNANKALNN